MSISDFKVDRSSIRRFFVPPSQYRALHALTERCTGSFGFDGKCWHRGIKRILGHDVAMAILLIAQDNPVEFVSQPN